MVNTVVFGWLCLDAHWMTMIHAYECHKKIVHPSLFKRQISSGSRCVFARLCWELKHLLTEGLAFATEVVPKLYLRSYKKNMTLHNWFLLCLCLLSAGFATFHSSTEDGGQQYRASENQKTSNTVGSNFPLSHHQYLPALHILCVWGSNGRNWGHGVMELSWTLGT